MNFSLIICTYLRPCAVVKLLESILIQQPYPNEILIIDGSPDLITANCLKAKSYKNVKYFNVEAKDRGLTRQRNFGINKVSQASEIIFFLDDDTVLSPDYFINILSTYLQFPSAVGVGGYIQNEIKWEQKNTINFREFGYDGWVRPLGSRNVLRKILGLLSDKPPGYMPEFSNGLSIGFLPPSGKIYPVEFFMGGVASYRKGLFKEINFSKYFEGYGLYEDLEFCLRAAKLGPLYVNTAATLFHYHEKGGRPLKFSYGKMVIRNGWYVWRLKYPKPSFKSLMKWHFIALLLTLIRFSNVIDSENRMEAFTESLGRFWGWWTLLFLKPRG